MPRTLVVMIGLFIAFTAQTFAADPERAAPIYSLPTDDAWIEYNCTAIGPGGKEMNVTLRISSVGTKDDDGTRSRWVEIRKEFETGKEKRREYRKLLVAEKAFADKPNLQNHVRLVYGQDGDRTPFLLSPARKDEFLTMGLQGSGTELREVKASETVDTKLGKYAARSVTARGKSGDRELEYRGWLTADVPFGCVRFEIYEKIGDGPQRRIFTAEAVLSGRGAKAEVDESRGK
jgi:hypothetical protein